MNATELRIGNLVHVKNRKYSLEDDLLVATVYSVAEYKDGMYSVGCEIGEYVAYGQLDRDVAPIRFNEEWARNFGYKNLNEMASCFCVDSVIKIDEQDMWIHLMNLSVHEVQNFYHALTGVELQPTIVE